MDLARVYRKAEGEGEAACMTCRGTGWTAYRQFALDGSVDEAKQLCHCVPTPPEPSEEEETRTRCDHRTPRIARAKELIAKKGDQFRTPARGVYKVPSRTKAHSYWVDLKRGTCDCPSYEHTGRACLHVFAAELVRVKGFKWAYDQSRGVA